MLHRLYLVPGLFGFGRLASYDYFAHVLRALEARFHAAGEAVTLQVVESLPTASVRRRTMTLAERVASSCQDDEGPIHLLGHSTGGLDARLVASPSARLSLAPELLCWLPRLRSVTTMNTPHFGTPLAKFFATVNGQRLLYALSALTFLGLSAGEHPLTYASAAVGLVGRGERALGLKLGLLDRIVDTWLRRLDQVQGEEVREYLDGIKRDQGAVLQLTPEAMDLFQAGVEDRPDIAYQSTASMTPQPSLGHWLTELVHPTRAASLSLFATLHGFTGLRDQRYPCHAVRSPGSETPWAGDAAESLLASAFGSNLDARASDGVVPLRSQLWGTVLWAGFGDHLDVIGHYRDPVPDEGPPHVDWLTSGSSFGPRDFAARMDRITAGMLRASTRRVAVRARASPRG